MKRPLLAVLFLSAASALSGCMVTTTARRVYVYDPPPPAAYVYTYADGCWADGAWYAPCPWSPGPSYGYYGYWGGSYRWYPEYRWSYRPGHPPPRHWWHGTPPRPYRPAHPHAGPPRRF